MQKFLDKYFFLAPIFLITYFVLHEVNANYGLIPILTVLKLGFLYLLIAFLLNLIFYLLFRNLKQTGFVTTAAIIFFLFFGALHDSLKSLSNSPFIRSHIFIFLLIALIMLIIIFTTKRIIRTTSRLYSFAMFVIMILCGWEIIHTMVNLISNRQKINNLSQGNLELAKTPNNTKPDIFFIVFDSYTSSGCLKNEFGFSNPLDSILTGKGFYISRNSKSNYPLTPFSIASTFNLNYLNPTVANREATAQLMLQGANTIYESQLPAFLSKEGYKLDNFSTFDLNNHPALVRAYFDELREKLIDEQTLWGRFNAYLHWNFIQTDSVNGQPPDWLYKRRSDYINNYIKDNLHGLDSISKLRDTVPHFVYCHVMLPHEPYLYKADGEFQPRSLYYDNSNPKEKFLAQTIYTNSIITNLLNELTRPRERPYTIIIEGDHGFRDFENKSDKSKVFQNLNAYYFSDQNYKGLYDSISPVNSFRVILNKYFNQHLQLLKDSSVYIRDPSFNFEKTK
jgi:hypothetical protein